MFLLCTIEKEEHLLSFDFSILLSNTLTSSGLERLFGLAFVFTVETGFIPTSLAEHFDSINSNIELAKMINNYQLNSFWHQNNDIFNTELIMSNQNCYLTGVPNGASLIITLSFSNVSKCTILQINNDTLNKKPVDFSHLSLKYKNLVSVPIKCAVLSMTIGQYPSLCGIPEELIMYIMAKLNSSDLYALIRCCKKINNLASNNQILWKNLVAEELKKLSPSQRNQLEQQNTDWRTYYFELRRKISGRKRITLIRE